jgi:hypothetical protein
MWDSPRQVQQSGLLSAIAGGGFGQPSNTTAADETKLACGGHNSTAMAHLPASNPLPLVIDTHMYPCIERAGEEGGCDPTKASLVFAEAQRGFDAVKELLSGWNLWGRTFMIGETHPNTTYLWGINGAPATVSGYNSSSLRGWFTVFRPWGELYNPHAGWPYVHVVNPPYFIQF